MRHSPLRLVGMNMEAYVFAGVNLLVRLLRRLAMEPLAR